ncbi:nucleotidyl transferase AbiEii/AbiGii toxin family protein [Nonomuraea typhae]|uniref:Nucleotidyl transferase AbiEii/AbiGii toxin family protein n=1 Tax=Nonomuraea typhae TaxID=2603600 RepID=A0ABW7YYZ0_9ACTN
MDAVQPVCERYGLVLAGGYAMRAHGFTDRPSMDLDFATAAEIPLQDVAHAVADAFRSAGLETHIVELTPRMGRLLVTEPLTGDSCAFDLLREALQVPAVTCGRIRVVGLDDAIGLKLRALHERSLPRDVIDVAAVSHLYGFRQLERLARLHNDEFSVTELLMRLEFVDAMDDQDFFAYGITEERVREIRRFAYAWVEDIKLRRADEGDIDLDVPDLPPVD